MSTSTTRNFSVNDSRKKQKSAVSSYVKTIEDFGCKYWRHKRRDTFSTLINPRCHRLFLLETTINLWSSRNKLRITSEQRSHSCGFWKRAPFGRFEWYFDIGKNNKCPERLTPRWTSRAKKAFMIGKWNKTSKTSTIHNSEYSCWLCFKFNMSAVSPPNMDNSRPLKSW